MKLRFPARFLACLILFGLASSEAAERVVAIGDIHGAYQEFTSILQAASLTGKDLAWTGGHTILVQTGDVLDRGPESRQALDLLMELTEQARRQGGEVRPLLGNHEAMVMTGDLRYVSPQDYRNHATADSRKVQQNEWDDYLKYRTKRAKRMGGPPPALDETAKQTWLKAHPPGFFELRDAYSPKGKYGAWLRERDAITQIDDMVFLHGGLSPQSPLRSVKEINERVRRDLAVMDALWSDLVKKGVLWPYLSFEEARTDLLAELQARQGESDSETKAKMQMLANNAGESSIYSPEGPLWYRGLSMGPEAPVSGQLPGLLKQFKIDYIVVGHTVTESRRITPRFGGHVIAIDTGMLAPFFQGRPSALEIVGHQFKAIYAGEPPEPVSAWQPK